MERYLVEESRQGYRHPDLSPKDKISAEELVAGRIESSEWVHYGCFFVPECTDDSETTPGEDAIVMISSRVVSDGFPG